MITDEFGFSRNIYVSSEYFRKICETTAEIYYKRAVYVNEKPLTRGRRDVRNRMRVFGLRANVYETDFYRRRY